LKEKIYGFSERKMTEQKEFNVRCPQCTKVFSITTSYDELVNNKQSCPECKGENKKKAA